MVAVKVLDRRPGGRLIRRTHAVGDHSTKSPIGICWNPTRRSPIPGQLDLGSRRV